MFRRLLALIAVVSIVVSCTPEEAQLTTTTTLAATTTTTTAATTTTTTTVGPGTDAGAEPAIRDYEIVVRSSTSAGEVLWILVDPGDYTDIDLENLIRELVDDTDFELDGVHVFDDRDALEAGRIAEGARTADEQELVEAHFLVSLVDGAVIRFQGPFAEFGESSVGS